MVAWLPLALFAMVAWALQRLLSKVALRTLGTRKFYLLSALVSLCVYAPYLVIRPPAGEELPAAFGLACLMAVTFGVTSEAIRRGPLRAVSPITALSPALTAALGVLVLSERLSIAGYLGIALALMGVAVLSLGPRNEGEAELPGWKLLALLSLILQGLGAFVAKLVVSPTGPSALLLTSAGVQVAVGLVIAPPWTWTVQDLSGRPAAFTLVGYAIAGVATIGYLLALASGPATAVVPLVATSPALAGLLGIVFLRERRGARHWAGIALSLTGAALLSRVA